MTTPPDLDGLPPEWREFVLKLLAEISEQKRLIAELREEVARLKGLSGRPSIKPSGMDQGTTPKPRDQRTGRRGRGKTTPRVSVEDQMVPAEVPPGSRLRATRTSWCRTWYCGLAPSATAASVGSRRMAGR